MKSIEDILEDIYVGKRHCTGHLVLSFMETQVSVHIHVFVLDYTGSQIGDWFKSGKLRMENLTEFSIMASISSQVNILCCRSEGSLMDVYTTLFHIFSLQ